MPYIRPRNACNANSEAQISHTGKLELKSAPAAFVGVGVFVAVKTPVMVSEADDLVVDVGVCVAKGQSSDLLYSIPLMTTPLPLTARFWASLSHVDSKERTKHVGLDLSGSFSVLVEFNGPVVL